MSINNSTYQLAPKNAPANATGAESKIVRITHDRFAQLDVVRRIVRATTPCAWCEKKRGQPRRFQYGLERESGGITWSPRLFCNIACWRSYYGLTIT